MITTEQTLPARDVKKGEFVKRKPDAKKVYIRGDYDRASKRYSLQDWDDISREVWVKGSAPLFVGFEF
jgi:hypothetical protein